MRLYTCHELQSSALASLSWLEGQVIEFIIKLYCVVTECDGPAEKYICQVLMNLAVTSSSDLKSIPAALAVGCRPQTRAFMQSLCHAHRWDLQTHLL